MSEIKKSPKHWTDYVIPQVEFTLEGQAHPITFDARNEAELIDGTKKLWGDVEVGDQLADWWDGFKHSQPTITSIQHKTFYRLPQGLSREQVDACRRAVSAWIQIRNENEHGAPTSADADHSSLLWRLLSGKPPLPFAPPCRFSYPDYELAEGKPVCIHDVWHHPGGSVVIDQSPEWEPAGENLYRHLPTGEIYRLFDGEATVTTRRGDTWVKEPVPAKFLQKVVDRSAEAG
jgi:hypothetical protein